jgi:hypothetical protein
MLNIITELNPYFKHPYIIWELLLPDYNERYENLTIKEQKKHINQAVMLWLKWIKNFCNLKKINLIKNETNLKKIWTDKKYENPCKEYEIPYYLAYIYHFYKKDPKTASLYYKITSANKDSIKWSKILAAIMTWKWWEREKSYFMFLNIAQSIDEKDPICKQFSSTLKNLWINIFIKKKIPLNENIIKNIWNARDKLLWKFNEDKEKNWLWDTDCWNYLNKAIRELNLKYIENADKKYFKKYWKHSINALELYKKWFIKYLPIDYQQYKNYWIIYEFDKDTWHYNYKLWTY